MDFLPGLVQGIVRVSISYPFDVIKVYSQNNGRGPLENALENVKRNPSAFYRGSSIMYCTVSLERAVQFRYFEKLKNDHHPLVCGLMITVPLTVVTIPAQAITNNIVLKRGSGIGVFEFVRSFIRERGLRSLYRGYFVESARYVTATTVYFGVYGSLRKDDATKTRTAVNSIAAAYSSWAIAYPMDLVKTLVQTDPNWRTTLKDRFRKNGPVCLWTGITPVLFRTVPSTVLGMLAYEHCRTLVREST